MTQDVVDPADDTAVGGRLADAISDLTGGGRHVPDPERVVEFVADLLRHSDHCSVTFMRPGQPLRTIATTDELPVRVDNIQYSLGEGPCVSAATQDYVCLAQDLATDERWPTFGPRCVEETGIHSMLGFRVPIGGPDEAALNVFARAPGALTEDDVTLLALVAPLASLAVQARTHEHDVGNLRTALSTSRQIGTAIGILMARHLISSDEALTRLRHSSQSLNRKLRDVAQDVELSGSLPGTEDG